VRNAKDALGVVSFSINDNTFELEFFKEALAMDTEFNSPVAKPKYANCKERTIVNVIKAGGPSNAICSIRPRTIEEEIVPNKTSYLVFADCLDTCTKRPKIRSVDRPFHVEVIPEDTLTCDKSSDGNTFHSPVKLFRKTSLGIDQGVTDRQLSDHRTMIGK
jgi:hypothetical protein